MQYAYCRSSMSCIRFCFVSMLIVVNDSNGKCKYKCKRDQKDEKDVLACPSRLLKSSTFSSSSSVVIIDSMVD